MEIRYFKDLCKPCLNTPEIVTVIGMVTVLVEVLLLSGGAMTQGKGGGDGKPENGKEWLRNNLKALASILGKLGRKQQKLCLASLGQSSAGSSKRLKYVVD